MSSSQTGITSPLACSICGEHIQSCSSLHQHHLLHHTTEELSLALISLKETEQAIPGIENEHSLYSQLHKVQMQCDVTTSSQNTEDTGQYKNSIDQTKQMFQNNEDEGPEVNPIEININEKDLEKCSQNIGAKTLNKQNNIHKKDSCLCYAEPPELSPSNTEKLSSVNLNGIIRNNDIKPEAMTDTETQCEYKSSNAFKEHRMVQKEIHETEKYAVPNHGVIHSEIDPCLEDSGKTVLLDMECVDDFDRPSFEKVLDISSSSMAGNSSTDSELSMLPTQSEICIQAIVTRLSNIVKAASKPVEDSPNKCNQNVSKKLEKDYILPSPLRKYHQSKVSYSYGSLRDNESFIEGTIGAIDDFFRPSIKMNGFKDAQSETVPIDLSEKEVQVDFEIAFTLTSVSPNMQERNTQTAGKTHSEKHTQTGIISLTTRRLAAYRKPLRTLPLSDNSSKPLNVDSGSVSALPAKPPEKEFKVYPRITAERRFFCEHCGKGYKKKSHLERHVRVHTGERPFPCSYCEKRFAVRSILKQHVRTHTGEKPYCCSLCLQRFPQKSGLMTHTMLHTGKPFKCDKCEKAFVSNHKLLQHLRSHGSKSGRKHACSICKIEFLTEGALLQHKQIHNNKPLFLSHNFNNLFSK